MPAAFSQTLRSLREDRTVGRTTLLLAAVAVMLPWGLWSVAGEITLRESSSAGRVEVARAATTVGAPREARVLSVRAVLGASVAEGDVLVELDPGDVLRRIDAARARLAAVAPRTAAIRREIAAERNADAMTLRAEETSLEAVRARIAEAKADQDLAEHQAKLAENLAAQRAGSAEGAREARSKAVTSAARVRSQEAESARIASGFAVERADRAARVAKLERDVADLDAHAAAESAEITRLDRELADYTVRSPTAGRIGELSPVRGGSVVEVADPLCVIVPEGAARIVASFPLRSAGRVREGQPARVRFDGFPWARFGTLAAHVATVGTPEPSGNCRVELDLEEGQPTEIPVGHGLACTAEVEVERVTPLDLALRSAGRLLDGSRDADPPPDAGRAR